VKKVLIIGVLIAIVVSLVACGTKTTTTMTTTQTSTQTTTTQAYNDTIPWIEPANDGILATLPKAIQADYNGLDSKLINSPYATFKAKAPPYKIYYCAAFRGNGWQEKYIGTWEKNIEAYKAAGIVSEYVFQIANGDLNTQIQQIQTAIEKGADMILINALSTSGLDNLIKSAYDKGIVVMTYSGAVTSPYALNILASGYNFAATEASMLVKYLNGKGHIIVVDGMLQHPANQFAHGGEAAVLDQNPGITYDVVNGNWDNANAKEAVLKYFATHPGKVDAILNQVGMFDGCREAVEQSGRPLMPITDAIPDISWVAFAHENKGKPGWKTFGSTNSPGELSDTNFRIAIATLMGFGPKINTFLEPALKITDENIDSWYTPDMKVGAIGVADPPRGTVFGQDWLNTLFTKPPVLPVDTQLHPRQ
jgi:ribose transport system substrate-binding protein